jgi:fimbrial chaperone protein
MTMNQPIKNARTFITSLLLWLSLNLSAQVGITPRLLELDQSQINKSQSFRLYNFTDEAVEVAVEINNWTMDQANQIELLPSTEQSLDQWTVVNPLNFMVKPQSSQTVRLAFRPPPLLPDGEYQAMIYFNQVLTDNDPDKKQLRSRFRIGAAVYLQQGPMTPSATVNRAWIEGDQLFIEVTNTGNTHVRFNGHGSLWNGEPKPDILNPDQPTTDIAGLLLHEPLPTTPVLPGHTRRLRMDLGTVTPDPQTNYQLLLTGQLANQDLSMAIPITSSDVRHHGQ